MSSTTVTAKNTKSSSSKKAPSTDNSALLERFNALAAEMETIRKSLPSVLGIKKRRAAASDSEAEPAARSAWQEWAATCAKRFSADYATHLAELDKKADVMGFAAKCRAKTHVAEWTEHETAWDTAHPKPVKEAKPKRTKGSKANSAAAEMVADSEEAVILATDSLPRATSPPPGSRKSKKAAVVPAKEGSPPSSEDEGSTSSKKKKSKEPVADSSSSSSSNSSSNSSAAAPAKKLSAKEEKAAAKRALTEAATAAAAADPPIPWTYRGTSYLKNTANQIWANEDGELGAWVGTFDGKKLEKSDGPSA